MVWSNAAFFANPGWTQDLDEAHFFNSKQEAKDEIDELKLDPQLVVALAEDEAGVIHTMKS